ncbi:MAG: glutamate racemase [Eubacterium sp.]|nr:glutamate racemase [Eubacterium sp.]
MLTETETGKYKDYIGVFDSGVGGLSVLKELVKELPEEDFLYFGDSANAPYGEKEIGTIRELSMKIADRMVADGVKTIVIACNTATSAAVKEIRAKYQERMPIIGIEPALKPAARWKRHGRILVMATPATLKLEKYEDLSHRLEGEAEFIPVMCTGLASRVEKGNLEEEDLHELLEELLGPYRGKVDGIVLGCTHYPFVKRQIRSVMGDIPMFDGGEGTAHELHRQLEKHGLLKKKESGDPGNRKKGEVVLLSSIPGAESEELYREMFRMEI